MRQLKHYAHLYLGCELISKATNEVTGKLEGVVGNMAHFRISGVWYSAPIEDYKISLKLLESMTEEEKKEYSNMVPDSHNGASSFSPWINLNSKRTLWALSKHFDLFNLIPEGLAISSITK